MFKDGCSLIFDSIIAFHDKANLVVFFIAFFVLFTLMGVWLKRSLRRCFLEDKCLEVVWTLIPAVVLLILSAPSLFLLYFIDSPILRGFYKRVVKIEGHQWYWRYEYEGFLGGLYAYDSFMVPARELSLGGYRLLETDKPLVIREKVILQGSTTDVIHSWACPSLGVKFDVVPGRLNSFGIVPTYVGRFYGQCSEICGAKHRFMPVEVEVIFKGYLE